MKRAYSILVDDKLTLTVDEMKSIRHAHQFNDHHEHMVSTDDNYDTVIAIDEDSSTFVEFQFDEYDNLIVEE